jgi:hypothetical protein
MDNNNQRDYSVTSFSNVVVRKDELLKTLEVNREKHNSIYNAAVSGYWVEAQKVLDKKREEFAEQVAETNRKLTEYQGRLANEFAYQASGIQGNINEQNKDKIGGFSLTQSFSYAVQFNGYWPLSYPENHLEDYDRVIDMLKYSVADKVELSSKDFDAYVRNNWSWRNSFLSTNAVYTTGCLISLSGSAGYSLVGTGYSPIVMNVTGGSVANTYSQLNRAF